MEEGALLSLRFSEENGADELAARQMRQMDHSIRTRLNMILTALAAIQRQPLPEGSRKYLAIIAQNAMRLLRSSTHVSLLCQPIEQWQTHLRTVDLCAALSRLQACTGQVIPETCARIEWDLPDEAVVAVCDEEQLTIALFTSSPIPSSITSPASTSASGCAGARARFRWWSPTTAWA